MGFLHELWDETMAGPVPDSGLSSLRKLKFHTKSPTSSHRQVAVTRRITITSTSTRSTWLRRIAESPAPAEIASMDVGKSVTRKASSDQVPGRAEPRSPTVYDWIVISALDR